MARQPEAVRREVEVRMRKQRVTSALGRLRGLAGKVKRALLGAATTNSEPQFSTIDAAATHVGKITNY
jgi:hypothetical protein